MRNVRGPSPNILIQYRFIISFAGGQLKRTVTPIKSDTLILYCCKYCHLDIFVFNGLFVFIIHIDICLPAFDATNSNKF